MACPDPASCRRAGSLHGCLRCAQTLLGCETKSQPPGHLILNSLGALPDWGAHPTPFCPARPTQGLTIVVRTAARMGCRLPPPALEAWARAAVARLPDFKGQDVANSLYSRALLGP